MSLKKPNRRYKVSHEKLVHRLTRFWQTLFRVRAFLRRWMGREPIQESADQKGFYFNEAGSALKGTLAPEGEEDVVIIEHHANSRKRYSVMTSCVSDLSGVPGGIPPLSFVFKGDSDLGLKGMVIPTTAYGRRLNHRQVLRIASGAMVRRVPPRPLSGGSTSRLGSRGAVSH